MFVNIEAKGEKENIDKNSEQESGNVNIYEMVKKCVVESKDSTGLLNELLDLTKNLAMNEPFQITKKPRANSLI